MQSFELSHGVNIIKSIILILLLFVQKCFNIVISQFLAIYIKSFRFQLFELNREKLYALFPYKNVIILFSDQLIVSQLKFKNTHFKTLTFIFELKYLRED